MEREDTGSNTIYRYNNVMNKEYCNMIYDYTIQNTSNDFQDLKQAPWATNNTIFAPDIIDSKIKEIISLYTKKINLLVNTDLNSKFTPVGSQINLWGEGQSWAFHQDNTPNHPALMKSKIIMISYLNDDYVGGETMIKNERNEIYMSKPRTGSIVFFYSDERNMHGVNKIISGKRATYNIWFKEMT